MAPQLRRRVFFAFWPDVELRAAVAHATHKAARACGGRPVFADSLHVTLLFLGAVAESRLPDLVTIGDHAAATTGLARETPVHLIFDRIEFWETARVLVATTSSHADVASGLAVATVLAETLSRETHRAGFAPDLKPFRAHITVARKVARAGHELHMRKVRWPIAGFALVESRTLPEGLSYSVVDSWPLSPVRPD